MLYYVPLEPYEQRYTEQLSRAKTGWLESQWINAGIEYQRISGLAAPGQKNVIETGQVVDGLRRWEWAQHQISTLISLAKRGVLTDDDVIYFDDFWTPGLMHLFYVLEQLTVYPKMYSFCYAQSVDEHDFTSAMLPWIRDFEKGIGHWMTGVFVANTLLADKLVDAKIVPENRVHVTGLIFDSAECQSRLLRWTTERQDRVVFSSR